MRAVPIASSRDVSDPRTDSGVRVRGPRVSRRCEPPFRLATVTRSVVFSSAAELTDAIAQHAYRKHWGHSVLGLLACRCDELDTAVSHLIASADVRPDYRLSSYGPSLDLLREI
jgi:hypothetical protein